MFKIAFGKDGYYWYGDVHADGDTINIPHEDTVGSDISLKGTGRLQIIQDGSTDIDAAGSYPHA